MTAPRLEVVDLTLTVGAGAAGLTLLSGLSLTLAPGASLALTGRSGSGKSSLLHCLGGLLTPQEGTVTWQPAGAAPSLLSAAEEGVRAAFRRQHLGFVFQFFHLVPTLTALENVAFMAELAGMGAPKERAEAMLEAVGLADRRHVFPESLSGGEQQRVAVARALVHAPAAVLADEPTGNLDAQTAETVAEVLFTQTRAAGASLVLVTHDPALAAQAGLTLALGGP
ncbi:MAG: ABC transporter ATP-binding protein [Pseudomonadota bacterium]|nr:ABC transporter ATP-binding protein [Pseudomonadota bacterium]